MKKLTIFVSFSLLVFGGIAILDAAQPSSWQLIGERSVTDRVDHDVIKVTRSRGQWSAIKVVVRKHAVQFRGVRVVYANGTTQSIALRTVIPAGGESRVIDLVGDNRTIQRIEMRYDAQSLGGKAVVTVFGRR